GARALSRRGAGTAVGAPVRVPFTGARAAGVTPSPLPDSPAADADSRSTRITLRSLLTLYTAGDVSATRTRASAWPSTLVACSSVTPARGAFLVTFAPASPTVTLRRSTNSVSGSGRLTE